MTEKMTADELLKQHKAESEVKEDVLATENFDVSEVDPKKAVNAQLAAYNRLQSEKDRELARKMAESIDIHNSGDVLSFGSQSQRENDRFSRQLLDRVKVGDTGEVGDSLNELMTTLNENNPDFNGKNGGFFAKMLAPIKRKATEVQQSQQTVGARIDKIAEDLDYRQELLIQDTKMLDNLYNINLKQFDDLNMYIAAGELKIKEIEEEILPKAMEKANESLDQMDAQQVKDLNEALSRLDKRVHDLRLSRQICIQQAPQIRLIQASNQALAEKIQSATSNAIPIWRNQFTISLALGRQEDSVKAAKSVSDTTNALLTATADKLNMGAIEVARESERGLVEVETLEHVQAKLIDTIKETVQIQHEGREARKAAQERLVAMEQDMKQQLLTLSNEQGAYASASAKRERKNVN